MKRFLWTVAGVCAAAAGLLIWGPRPAEPAHQLPYLLERGRSGEESGDESEDGLGNEFGDEPESPRIAG